MGAKANLSYSSYTMNKKKKERRQGTLVLTSGTNWKIGVNRNSGGGEFRTARRVTVGRVLKKSPQGVYLSNLRKTGLEVVVPP